MHKACASMGRTVALSPSLSCRIKKQLERAMESMDWAMDGPVDVVKLYQQQEDMKFLSHFGGKFIVHWVCILLASQ